MLTKLRLPRPRRFLGFLDLQVGTELVLMTALFNKVSGIYGVLAVLTGAEISAVQLSMYIYSVFAVAAVVFAAPHIRKRTPLPVISFAYFYLLDSVVNATYTSLFGVTWFLVISDQRQRDTFEDEYDTKLSAATLANGALQPESATSIFIICLLWAVRCYFCLVVLAFARRVVRDSATPASAPFTGKNNGEGWQGKIGRALVGVNKSYWEGPSGWTGTGGSRKYRRSEEPVHARRMSLPR